MCNKETLLNQSAFVLGVPGSGKSFSVKELITFLMLDTDDDILICDPEGEFAPLVEAMGDDIGTVTMWQRAADTAQRHVHGGGLWRKELDCG